MIDIVEALRHSAMITEEVGCGSDRGRRIASSKMREAADEIELLRQKLQFAEFEWNRATLSWQDAERRAAVSSTERSPTGNIEGGA